MPRKKRRKSKRRQNRPTPGYYKAIKAKDASDAKARRLGQRLRNERGSMRMSALLATGAGMAGGAGGFALGEWMGTTGKRIGDMDARPVYGIPTFLGGVIALIFSPWLIIPALAAATGLGITGSWMAASPLQAAGDAYMLGVTDASEVLDPATSDAIMNGDWSAVSFVDESEVEDEAA